MLPEAGKAGLVGLLVLAPGAGQDLGDRQIGNGGDVELETACVFQVGQLWCGQQRRKFFVSCLLYRSYSQGVEYPYNHARLRRGRDLLPVAQRCAV